MILMMIIDWNWKWMDLDCNVGVVWGMENGRVRGAVRQMDGWTDKPMGLELRMISRSNKFNRFAFDDRIQTAGEDHRGTFING